MDCFFLTLILFLLVMYIIIVVKEFRYLNSLSKNAMLGRNLLIRKKPYRFLYGKLYYPVLSVVYEIYDSGIYLSGWFLDNYFLWKDFNGIYYSNNKLCLTFDMSKIVFFDIDAEIIFKLIPKTLVYS